MLLEKKDNKRFINLCKNNDNYDLYNTILLYFF